jgi:hypothetical protein
MADYVGLYRKTREQSFNCATPISVLRIMPPSAKAVITCGKPELNSRKERRFHTLPFSRLVTACDNDV